VPPVATAPDTSSQDPHRPSRTKPRRPSWHSRPIGYIPALDGMRAVAVGLVIAYHLGYSGVAGGYIGVEVFFVLSGWLVCALLMNEQQRTGGIALAGFWRRRARRLLPAVLVVVAGTVLVASVVDPRSLAELRTQAIAAITYHLNWREIVDQQSYFAAAEGPSGLEHLWSLSIEEQFYLFFPLLATFVLARTTRVSAVRLVLLFALVSTALRWALYTPNADPSRVYFGTDTRLSGLLLGVALGLFWTPNRLRPHASRGFTVTMDLVALAGAFVVAWYAFGLDEHQTPAFRDGFTAVQVGTLAVLAVAVYPAPTVTAGLLSAGPLRWVGERSYGIYLIHWPVIVFLSDAPGEQPESAARVVVEVALVLGLAALSYRYVEQPVRLGGLRRSARAVGHWLVDTAAGRPAVALGIVAAGSLVFVVTLGVTREVVTASAPVATDPQSVVIGPGEATSTTAAVTTTTSAATLPAPGSLMATTTTTTAPPPPPAPPAYATTTAIGDSVMVGAAQALANRLGPSLTVNAEVGRQLDDAVDLVAAMAADGTLGQVVLVNLGTNGPTSPERLDALLAAAGPDRRVLLVNVVVPRQWESEVNDQLAAAAGRHPNAVLLDWRALATTEPGLLREDGFHVTTTGAERYADLIVAHIPTA
jgi:peptidoglycan/LPS O-acetylase OafA/YrhL/lysophospholipase L1-like esterase